MPLASSLIGGCSGSASSAIAVVAGGCRLWIGHGALSWEDAMSVGAGPVAIVADVTFIVAGGSAAAVIFLPGIAGAGAVDVPARARVGIDGRPRDVGGGRRGFVGHGALLAPSTTWRRPRSRHKAGNTASRAVLRRGDGGPSRNRTGVQGFAVLCVTTPPSGRSGACADFFTRRSTSHACTGGAGLAFLRAAVHSAWRTGAPAIEGGRRKVCCTPKTAMRQGRR